MTNAPKIIREKVEQFETNLRAYKSTTYKEEQLKHEFLNVFFKALGWDVYNEKNAAPQHRDVIFEDSIKIGGGTKAPDYCFTLAGKRMFFVEAKKPSVDIKKDVHPAFQLRRYAWSAKLPLSILTDFEEFAVYETRTRPQKEDKAGTGRVMYLTYKDYIDQWDEIASRFSYDAVVQGYFDRFAETTEKKRGTQEVDSEFL
ncbi:MAG: type I restriction endonuclease [Halobacteriota archaeon]